MDEQGGADVKRNDEGGMVLTPDERRALALLMIARVAGADDAVEWDEVPELAEGQFDCLLDEIQEQCEYIRFRLATSGGEDPEFILGQLS